MLIFQNPLVIKNESALYNFNLLIDTNYFYKYVSYVYIFIYIHILSKKTYFKQEAVALW